MTASLTFDGEAPWASSRSRTSCSWRSDSARCARNASASPGSPATSGAARIWAIACSSMEWASVRYLMSWSSIGRRDMSSPYPAPRGANAWPSGRYRPASMAGSSDTRDGRDPDSAALARRAAALEQVRMWGDPVLRTPARPVERFDAALAAQATRMARLMDEALGAGLAANQIGLLNRLLVYRVDRDAPLRVLVNPEVEWAADEEELFAEGCLSLPGVWVDVARPARVRVRARDENGRPLTVEAEGREASIVQHEIDHLDGVLVLDRLDPDARRAAVRRLRVESVSPLRLRLLLEVQRRGSIAAAADACAVGQPSASMHLRTLEAATGRMLLRRNGRGSGLTDAGTVVAGHAARILAE